MSTTSRRVLAATVAAVIAVLTGIVVGLVGMTRGCVSATAPAQPTSSSGVSGAQGGPGQVAPAQRCDESGFQRGPAVVALLGTLVAGGAVLGLMLLAGGGSGPRPVSPAAPRPARPVPAAGPAAGSASRREAQQAQADRSALVQACIYVRDRTTSRALAERLGAALAQAGITAVEPAAARFDPALHEAGGSAPSDDPARIGTIAAVEVPGYADRGQLLRPPVVTVYQTGTQTGNEAGRPASREDR